MASVTITYELSTEGKKASMLAGGNGQSVQTMTVTQDDPLFGEALTQATVDNDGKATLRLKRDHSYEDEYPKFDHTPSLAELLAVRHAMQAAVENKKWEKAREITEATRKVLTERETWTEAHCETDKKNDRTYNYRTQRPRWPYERDEAVVNGNEAQAWLRELALTNEEAKKEALIEARQKWADEAKAKAEADAAEAAEREALGLTSGQIALDVVEGALATVPTGCWEDRKRGKNWLAVIATDPKSPGGLHRDFCDKAKGDYFYLIDGLTAGDPVEFGSDYYSGSGKPSRDRRYFTVDRITETHVIMTRHNTAAQAIKAAKALKVTATVERSETT
jgi:hypothetical protein